jgi:hypothetical protein
MLQINGTVASRLSFRGGGAAFTMIGASERRGWAIANRIAFGNYVAKPAGYGENGMARPVKVGGLGSWVRDSASSAAAPIQGWGSVAGEPAGVGAATSPITGLKDAAALVPGVGAVVAPIIGRGTIAATIRIGANPSADDIVFALLDTAGTVDGLSMRELFRVMAAVLAGKVSGAGTNAPVFRAVDDSKDRVAATTDATGNRTSVTVDGA